MVFNEMKIVKDLHGTFLLIDQESRILNLKETKICI